MKEDIDTAMMDLNGKIALKQKEASLEQDPVKKQLLQKQLIKLQLKLQIQALQKRIEQLGPSL